MSQLDPPLVTSLGLAGRLARQWWPQILSLAAACGVVATTITGAVSVGRAMQDGLRTLALERLGRIDAAVVGEAFFTAELCRRLDEEAGGSPRLVPAIVMPAVIERPGGGSARVTLLACDDPAALGFAPAPPPLAPGGLLANAALAEAIGLTGDDEVILRLPTASSVPADSPLGRRTGESFGRRLAVTAVLPPRGIGQFSLRPTQATSPTAITSLAEARRILRRDDAANCLFAIGEPATGDAATWLREQLAPGPADYGLALEPASDEPASLRLTSSRLILPPAVDDAAAEILAPLGGRPTLIVLANAIEPLDRGGRDAAAASIPYSTVLGIEATSLPVGNLVDAAGSLLPVPADGEIIIDQWMADDLAAQGQPVAINDRLRLSVFEPETTHGRVVETTFDLTISGIAAMEEAATARGVVPTVEGITDEDSIADWDPPFPFDAARVRSTPPHDEDDRYWKDHGPTPKAFVSLATARRMAASRFGATTAWLVPQAGVADPRATAEQIAAAVDPAAVGLRVVALRADAVKAARGSTPFGSLFLALSSFVVVAGLLLAWLLFSLLVAARRRDLGILSAVGFPPRRLAALLVTVGGIAAALGTAGGVVLGPLWANALLAMLGRAWTAEVEAGAARAFAATRPAMAPLAAGGLAAIAVSLSAIAWAARRAGRLPPLLLLRNAAAADSRRRRGWLSATVAIAGLSVAALTATLGRAASPQEAVGLFFTAGFAALAGLLAIVARWLSAAPTSAAPRSLVGLALRDLGHAAGRAFSVAAIVAMASFLIVAVSSFAQRPPADLSDRAGPTGGWTEIVTLGAASGVDPADAEVRAGLGLSSAQRETLAACQIARLRSSGGDDAACTNLYATLRPTVLGVGPGFIARGGFRFLAHLPLPPGETNPWTLLTMAAADQPVPVILDQATAQWGLKLGGVGSEFTLPDDAGQAARFRIVGLLEPGILQGFVIAGEGGFEQTFPDRSGYAMALIDATSVPTANRGDVAAAVTAAWADAGVAITSASQRLASLQAVQNTFLSGFQALAALGLLLGTAGVAAVQLQGMLERLGTLAVLRAVGFTQARVRRLLALETILMVAIGLAVGTTAAVVAVAPALVSGEAELPLTWIAITAAVSLAAAVAAAAVVTFRAVIPTRPRGD